MSIDLTIIAIVFALVLFLVFFSAVVLYLSFRIKETFRKETRRGATVVKIAFLIGILFMAGGIFYFFANSFVAVNQVNPSPSPTPVPTLSPTTPSGGSQSPSTSPTQTPTATPVTAQPSNPTSSPSFTPSPTPSLSLSSSPTPSSTSKVTFSAAYPPTAKMSSAVTITFTIINPTGSTVQGATIQTNVLFQEFAVQSCNYPIVGNVINVGNLASGSTIVSLQLITSAHPTNLAETVSLMYSGETNPSTQQISIGVRGN